MILVIPLADLAALVEGLKLIQQYHPDGRDIEHPLFDAWCEDANSGTDFHQWLAQRLLTQLEAHRKEA